MDLSAPGYETERLRYEPLVEAHSAVLLNSEIEQSVWKYMPALRHGTNLRNYFDFLLNVQISGRSANYVLFRKADNQFVGLTGFSEINKIHRRLRNTIAWHPHELASEELYQAAQHGMLKRAYDWRAKRLEWQINPDNKFQMQHVASLNPTREAHFRNYERTAGGDWIDKIVFSMTRPELAAAIQTLETRLIG